MSNSLDPDQAQRFVGPGLGPNCLRRLSADTQSRKALTHISLPSFSWDIGKQNSPRCDAAKRGVPSADMLSFQKKMRDSARRLAFTMQFSRARRTHDIDITVNKKKSIQGDGMNNSINRKLHYNCLHQ